MAAFERAIIGIETFEIIEARWVWASKADSLRCFFALERDPRRLMFTTHFSASRMSVVIESISLSPSMT